MVTLQPRERRALEQLRSLERKWPLLRWLVLVYGLLALGTGWYVYHVAFSLAPQLDTTERVTFVFAYGALGAGFALVLYIGLTTLAWLLVRWRGDPIRTLLVRILDDKEKGADAAS